MVVEISDENIALLVEWTSCDHETATRYLKVKNNDLEAAVSAIFDQEDISQAETALAWSEGDFHTDREGNAAAHVENQLVPFGAPTRGSTPVPSLNQPHTSDDNDAGLQQALAASRGQLDFSQQEMGVMTTAKPPFGPDTRSQHDDKAWAMTLPGQEVMPDLDPADRVNIPGEPRCLRPLPSQEYLPNLLTILHSIPLSRKAFLLPLHVRQSYGQDPEWWKGHTIRMPRIVSTVDLSSAEAATSEGDELIAELQRLMALLDSSCRSYGSVDSLLRLDAVNNVTSDLPAETLADRVLHAWENAVSAYVSDTDALLDTFRSRMGTNDEDGSTPFMRLMPIKLDSHHSDHAVTLAEAINELLWDMDNPGEHDYYIEHNAEILCMHVSRDGKNVERAGLIIPPSFYIDQYLKENVSETRELRMEISKAKSRLTNIDLLRSKLENFSRGGAAGTVDSSLLMNHTIGHFSGQNRQTMLEDRLLSGADIHVDLPLPSEQHENIVQRLNTLYASIRTKLDLLSEERDKAKKVLAQLWRSSSENIPAASQSHRYWLRGVATKSTVTYILRPRDQETSAEAMMVEDEDAPPGMQWWRIEYDDSGTRITKTLAAQDDVIRAVELEHREALVVYASEDAIAAQDDDELPEALQDFIRKDNELFSTELHIAAQGHTSNVHVRQLERGRRGSADSTTVNLGDLVDADPPPYDEMDSPAHEITLDGNEPGIEYEMEETDHEPLMMGSRQRGSDNAFLRDTKSNGSHADVGGNGFAESMDMK